MREAILAAGRSPEAIASIARDPSDYLGFVEIHIEQGPVLNAADKPLGIVTSINGNRRFVGDIRGTASHAGTTPMDQRRDALAASAEWVLAVEALAAQIPGGVATVGMLQVVDGSTNVVPGACRFSLDVRAPGDAARDTLVTQISEVLRTIAERRGLSWSLEQTMAAAAAPTNPQWQARWERAVVALGLPLFHLPSGAGHDAMKMHEIMPQAMLFVRGEHAGISHNPLESITCDDADLAVQAFANLLGQLATEMP
jgi:N-carbamoyl-L-amino-acid hydrolase